MSRALPALLLLLSLATSLRAAPADAPADGRMVLDEVADGLRRYHGTKHEAPRRELLWRLASTRDPRVAVLLGEGLASSDYPFHELTLLARFYLPAEMGRSTDAVWDWWRAHEADLRRRANELP
jgi:hypothetical protein